MPGTPASDGFVAAIHVQFRHLQFQQRLFLFSLVAPDIYLPRLDSRQAVKIQFSHRHSFSCARRDCGRIRSKMKILGGVNEERIQKAGMMVVSR